MGSTPILQTDIAANLRQVASAMVAALNAADRSGDKIDLVAVSKTHPAA
ncbi:MAG: YggS family pyridoxal phosphate-dependent enzyme, partial [Proteobacteria bacterium]|nr:YggS family pyridoxal phosphate-dependent enzyme [Pseudomonadota bacterium]